MARAAIHPLESQQGLLPYLREENAISFASVSVDQAAAAASSGALAGLPAG